MISPISCLPDDILGSVLSYLLVEDSIRCSMINKEWSIVSIFTISWMYKQNVFQGKKGKQFLEPPPRTAGRVVNFRANTMKQRHQHHQHHQQHQHRVRKSARRNLTKVPPPLAPSSPAPAPHIFLPPSNFASARISFKVHLNNENNNSEKTDKKSKKINKRRQKSKRQPLVPKLMNTSDLEQTQTKLFPPKMKYGGSSIVHIIKPAKDLLIAESESTKKSYIPKTPDGKSNPRQNGARHQIRHQKKVENKNILQHVLRKEHTENVMHGQPYQYINPKTKQLGNILSALGGKGSILQKYYIKQHQPKKLIKRSTQFQKRNIGSMKISFSGRSNIKSR